MIAKMLFIGVCASVFSLSVSWYILLLLDESDMFGWCHLGNIIFWAFYLFYLSRLIDEKVEER